MSWAMWQHSLQIKTFSHLVACVRVFVRDYIGNRIGMSDTAVCCAGFSRIREQGELAGPARTTLKGWRYFFWFPYELCIYEASEYYN